MADRALVRAALEKLLRAHAAAVFGRDAAEGAAQRLYFLLQIRPLAVDLLLRALEGVLGELFPEVEEELQQVHAGYVPQEAADELLRARGAREGRAEKARGGNDAIMSHVLRGQAGAVLRAAEEEVDVGPKPRAPAAEGGERRDREENAAVGSLGAVGDSLMRWLGYRYVGHHADE
jgi:hypothetical protein